MAREQNIPVDVQIGSRCNGKKILDNDNLSIFADDYQIGVLTVKLCGQDPTAIGDKQVRHARCVQNDGISVQVSYFRLWGTPYHQSP